jgi:sorbitol-6-phosphate 2-dehydrogenase
MGVIMYQIISPLLRGLTYEGQAGKIVHFEDNVARIGFSKKPENRNKVIAGLSFSGKTEICGCTPLYIEAASEEDIIKEVTSKVESYRQDYRCGPKIVILEDRGVFTLGATYDEAYAVMEGVTKPADAPVPGSPAAGSPAAGPKAAGGPSVLPDEEEGGEEKARGDATRSRDDVVRGKISVVTGGAQGFGEALVRNLTAAGSLVFIADINLEGAASLADELNEAAGKTVALPVEVNVTDEESVQAMVDEVVRKAGGIDLYISNAGVLKAGSVKELSLDDFRFVTEVNYIGYFLGVKHASPVMALQNRASGAYFTDIIQINSKSGLKGSNKNGAYAGAKFGGIGLTQSFALELIEDNIKVNSICPGNFFEGPLWSDPKRGLFVQYLNAGKVPGAETIEEVKKFYESKVPMGRGCSGDDIIKTVYYLIEQNYETGQAVPVTGGQIMIK